MTFEEWTKGIKPLATTFTGVLYPVKYCYEDSGGFKDYNYLCHRYLSYMRHTNVNLIASVFSYQVTPEQKRYVDYLCSGDNPYEKAVKKGRFIQEDGYDLAVVFEDLGKTPMKLLVNFLEASRLGFCWGLAELWCYLVDQGFTGDEALALLTHFHWADQVVTTGVPAARVNPKPYKVYNLSTKGPWTNDQPFNASFNDYGKGSFFSVQRWLNRDPSTVTPRQCPQPCNYIWDEPTRTTLLDKKAILNPIKECYTGETNLPDGFVTGVKDYMWKGTPLD